MKKQLLAASIAAITSSIFSSQVIALDTIVVTASRNAQSVDDALASVTVITRDEIENSQATDLTDLLASVPGVEVVRSGGRGQIASIFTRGTESDHTLVLVDGVKINPGTLGSANISYLNPEMIERIEVVKGPRSTLYGSEAIGGVIQIFTRKSGPLATAVISGGADSTKEAGIQFFKQTDSGVKLGFGVNHFDTDGFPTLQASDLDTGHDNTSVNATVSAPLNESNTLSVSAFHNSGNTEYLGTDYSNFPAVTYVGKDHDFTQRNLTLALDSQLNDQWRSLLTLAHFKDETEQNQSDDFVQTNRTQLEWQNTVSLGQHLLTAGVSVQEEDIESLSFGSGFDQSLTTKAIYLQDSIQFDQHSLTLATRLTDHETFGNHTTWEVSYGYQFDNGLNLYSSIATGFRAPSASDMYGYGGNPELDPEVSTNYEVGAKFQINEQHHVSAAAFYNDIDDLINFVEVAPYTYQGRNVDEAKIKGVELTHTMRLDNLSWTTSATFQSPKNKETDTLLLRRAQRSLSTRVDYTLHGYLLGAELLAQSQRKDFAADMAGYGVVNLTVKKSLTDNLSIEGKLLNAFDKEYEVASGYNTQGRAGFVTLKAQF